RDTDGDGAQGSDAKGSLKQASSPELHSGHKLSIFLCNKHDAEQDVHGVPMQPRHGSMARAVAH
ncbi:hypothetical protein, partial [Streptomyces misionensis]